jgi:hypothetical protein
MNDQRTPLIRRTTAMTDAMVRAFEKAGIDTSGAKLPVKTEPTWRVSRREDKRRRR